jgi:hypothetical protein
MPEEAQNEVKDFYNNVKEKTEDHEHDHQTKDDPNPRAEACEINCHFDSLARVGARFSRPVSGGETPPLRVIYAVL